MNFVRRSAKLLPLSANASTVVRKGMLRDGSLWPAARIRASIASRPSRWISVSVAPLSLTEIIQFDNVCSVTGVSFGQFAVAAGEKLRCESGTTSAQGPLPAATWAPSRPDARSDGETVGGTG